MRSVFAVGLTVTGGALFLVKTVFCVSASNLDDLMGAVFKRLLSDHQENFKVKSKKGDTMEAFGALLELTNPRARLSRSQGRARVFSALGELIWYLSSSDSIEFIEYYIRGYVDFSDDGKSAYGAYGPRLFSKQNSCDQESPYTQWQRAIDTIRERKGSRNSVIQIFSNYDAAIATNDIPCTCTLQFIIRNERVYLHTHMRSNDAFLGLPHDIFSFTMLQEIAARELGYELGTYHHSVASLHLYDDNEKRKSRTLAQQYLDEGVHDIIPMPSMPRGDPWPAIGELVKAEAAIRTGNIQYQPDVNLDTYWKDLIILLKAYACSREKEAANKEMLELMNQITSPAYKLYVLDRIENKLGPAQRN